MRGPEPGKERCSNARRVGFQFSLRVLFFSITVLSVWLGGIAERAARQRDAVATIKRGGGMVFYDFQEIDQEDVEYKGRNIHFPIYDPSAVARSPAWARRLLGYDLLHEIVAVKALSDNFDVSALQTLPCLPGLRRLELADLVLDEASVHFISRCSSLESIGLSRIDTSEEALMELGRIRRLRLLAIEGPKVTSGFAEDFRRRAPNCDVFVE